MSKVTSPLVKTTKDFILIKIPRNLMTGQFSAKKISMLERGIQESVAEALSGKIIGPFQDGKNFLHALKIQPKQ